MLYVVLIIFTHYIRYYKGCIHFFSEAELFFIHIHMYVCSFVQVEHSVS